MNLEADIIEPADDAPAFPEDPLDDQELAIKYCLGQLSFEEFERDQICLYVCHSWGAFVRVTESAVEKTLSALSKKGSDDAQYLYLRPDSKMLLIALMYWAKDQILLGFSGADIDIDYFTVERAVNSYNRHDDIVALKEHQITRAQNLKPGKFKHDTRYYTWLYESVVSYVAAHYGRNDLPLDYLLREIEPPLQYEPRTKSFDTFEELAKHTVPLSGPKYTSDNKLLYELLIDLLYDTTAMSLLPKGHEKAKDGREVYLTICNYYKRTQGQVGMNKSAEQALSQCNYRGGPRESFSKFVDDLQHAFKLFDKAKNKMSDINKFNALFKSLKCHAHHDISAYMAQIHQQRISNPSYTFDDAIAYLSSVMTDEVLQIPANPSAHRRASKAKSKKHNSKYDKKRKNEDRDDDDDGDDPYDDWMDDSEYAQLSPDEKKELFEKRRHRKQEKQKNGDRPAKSGKKNIPKATQDVKPAPSVDVAAIYREAYAEAFARGREVGAAAVSESTDGASTSDAPSAAFKSLSGRAQAAKVAGQRRSQLDKFL